MHFLYDMLPAYCKIKNTACSRHDFFTVSYCVMRLCNVPLGVCVEVCVTCLKCVVCDAQTCGLCHEVTGQRLKR